MMAALKRPDLFRALVLIEPVFLPQRILDLLIAGAARTATWRSDLLINNPGASAVLVDVYWLYRDTTNTNPAPVSFTIQPEETLVLADVIRDTIGLNRGEGAFRIS